MTGRVRSSIRLLMALGQLAAGLVVATRRGPYWSPRARLWAIADATATGPHPRR